MLIERREFLALIGASSGMTGFTETPAISVREDLYVNAAIGFVIRKPRKWHFLTHADFAQVIRTHDIGEFGGDVRDWVMAETGGPWVTLSSLPSDDRHPSPSVIVWVEVAEWPVEEELEMHADGLELYRDFLPEFEAVEAPATCAIAGQMGSRSRFNFLFRTDHGAEHPWAMELYMIPHRKLLFSFQVSDARNGWSEGVRKEFDAILNSVRFVRSGAS